MLGHAGSRPSLPFGRAEALLCPLLARVVAMAHSGCRACGVCASAAPGWHPGASSYCLGVSSVSFLEDFFFNKFYFVFYRKTVGLLQQPSFSAKCCRSEAKSFSVYIFLYKYSFLDIFPLPLSADVSCVLIFFFSPFPLGTHRNVSVLNGQRCCCNKCCVYPVTLVSENGRISMEERGCH